MEDKLGNPLKIGDTVAWAKRDGNSSRLDIATIIEEGWGKAGNYEWMDEDEWIILKTKGSTKNSPKVNKHSAERMCKIS